MSLTEPNFRFPTKDNLHNFSSNSFQPGKEKIPYLMRLDAYRYSNSAAKRSYGGDILQSFILPVPTEGLQNGIRINYAEIPAKEQSALVRLFTQPTTLLSDVAGWFTKTAQDIWTTSTGIDYGRVPADMSENTFTSSGKRSFSFKWDLIALSQSESTNIMNMINSFSSYSLPAANFTSDRMSQPPMWSIRLLSNDGNSSEDISEQLLGRPRMCFMQSCVVSRDISVLYRGTEGFPTPLKYNIHASFVEIEPVFGQDGRIRSRSDVREGN